MSRVITFSRVFPKGHSKAGSETFFREKIWAGLADIIQGFKIPDHIVDWDWHQYYNAEPKWHTIRAGNRWKVGDKFSPRVWSGKPYRSKQIQFAPDIEIKKVWNVAYHSDIFFMNEKIMSPDAVKTLAKNDGLSLEDFYEWFRIHPKAKKEITEFQIVCWNEAIQY